MPVEFLRLWIQQLIINDPSFFKLIPIFSNIRLRSPHQLFRRGSFFYIGLCVEYLMACSRLNPFLIFIRFCFLYFIFHSIKFRMFLLFIVWKSLSYVPKKYFVQFYVFFKIKLTNILNLYSNSWIWDGIIFRMTPEL